MQPNRCDPRSKSSSVYLIDSSTCISVLRKRLPRALERLREGPIERLAISSISAAELYHGAARSGNPESEIRKIQNLLTLIRPVEFGSDAAISYGYVRSVLERQGRLIGLFDMLIAAHALAVGATVVTHNVREFRRVPGLVVEDWVD
jgi:tRNA(fMet)-specific endonuclease VapC